MSLSPVLHWGSFHGSDLQKKAPLALWSCWWCVEGVLGGGASPGPWDVPVVAITSGNEMLCSWVGSWDCLRGPVA